MAEVTELISNLIVMHEEFTLKFPEVAVFIDLMLLIILAFLYGLFIWKLHKFISTKNFLGKYFDSLTQSHHEFTTRLIYFVEYIIISPFLIFFWFLAFSIFITLLTEITEVTTLLIISTMIVATIRMTAYYNEDLSRDIAKILPFTLLAIAITNPTFFSVERVIERLGVIPSIFSGMLFYFLFIIILEAILRFFGFIFSLFGIEEEIVEVRK